MLPATIAKRVGRAWQRMLTSEKWSKLVFDVSGASYKSKLVFDVSGASYKLSHQLWLIESRINP